jgi:hypothetical protein
MENDHTWRSGEYWKSSKYETPEKISYQLAL